VVQKNQTGFTLIELIVMVTLLSIVMAFVLPRFQLPSPENDLNAVCRHITYKVKSLKQKTVYEQKQHTLHIDLSSQQIWVTGFSQPEIDEAQTRNDAYKLPDGIMIVNIEYPPKDSISNGIVDIHFFKEGYSDKALIHLEECQRRISILIEPFFTDVKIFEEWL